MVRKRYAKFTCTCTGQGFLILIATRAHEILQLYVVCMRYYVVRMRYYMHAVRTKGNMSSARSNKFIATQESHRALE